MFSIKSNLKKVNQLCSLLSLVLMHENRPVISVPENFGKWQLPSPWMFNMAPENLKSQKESTTSEN